MNINKNTIYKLEFCASIQSNAWLTTQSRQSGCYILSPWKQLPARCSHWTLPLSVLDPNCACLFQELHTIDITSRGGRPVISFHSLYCTSSQPSKTRPFEFTFENYRHSGHHTYIRIAFRFIRWFTYLFSLLTYLLTLCQHFI